MQAPEVTDFDRAALLEKARRRQATRVAIIAPAIFAVSLLAVLLGLREQHPPGHLTTTRFVVLIVICAFPAVAMVGMLALIRRGRLAWMQPTVFGGLSRRKRRRILRALRRGEGLADDDVASARELMSALQRSRWLPWLFAALPIVQVGNASSHDHVQRFLWSVTAAAFWTSAWWQLYVRYRIRIYAEMHWSA